MTEIDFSTALGRLLRDGPLRDAFARQPEAVAAQMHLRPEERPAFLQLVPADLEYQARILLRKRFDLVRPLLFETLRRMGENAWPQFLEYARTTWPTEARAALQDASQFSAYLRQQKPEWVSRSEWNRLQFARTGKHLAIHGYLRETLRWKPRPCLQLFFRGHSPKWREFIFAFGF